MVMISVVSFQEETIGAGGGRLSLTSDD